MGTILEAVKKRRPVAVIQELLRKTKLESEDLNQALLHLVCGADEVKKSEHKGNKNVIYYSDEQIFQIVEQIATDPRFRDAERSQNLVLDLYNRIKTASLEVAQLLLRVLRIIALAGNEHAGACLHSIYRDGWGFVKADPAQRYGWDLEHGFSGSEEADKNLAKEHGQGLGHETLQHLISYHLKQRSVDHAAVIKYYSFAITLCLATTAELDFVLKNYRALIHYFDPIKHKDSFLYYSAAISAITEDNNFYKKFLAKALNQLSEHDLPSTKEQVKSKDVLESKESKLTIGTRKIEERFKILFAAPVNFCVIAEEALKEGKYNDALKNFNHALVLCALVLEVSDSLLKKYIQDRIAKQKMRICTALNSKLKEIDAAKKASIPDAEVKGQQAVQSTAQDAQAINDLRKMQKTLSPGREKIDELICRKELQGIDERFAKNSQKTLKDLWRIFTKHVTPDLGVELSTELGIALGRKILGFYKQRNQARELLITVAILVAKIPVIWNPKHEYYRELNIFIYSATEYPEMREFVLNFADHCYTQFNKPLGIKNEISPEAQIWIYYEAEKNNYTKEQAERIECNLKYAIAEISDETISAKALAESRDTVIGARRARTVSVPELAKPQDQPASLRLTSNN